jgi:hypothetical protein
VVTVAPPDPPLDVEPSATAVVGPGAVVAAAAPAGTWNGFRPPVAGLSAGLAETVGLPAGDCVPDPPVVAAGWMNGVGQAED